MTHRRINRAQEGPLYRRAICLLLSMLLLGAFPGSAGAAKVVIVKKPHAEIHDRIIETIRRSLKPELAIALLLRDSENIDQSEIGAEADLVVALGHSAASQVTPAKRPTLYALLPKNMADLLLAPGISAPATFAIYLDQPAGRQLNLLKLLLPRATNVGLLTGPFSAHRLETLNRLTQERSLNLIHSAINTPKELNPALADLLLRSDVLLALPDPMVHNRRTLPHLLLTTYRHSVPVIGFSEAYVKAGAIAAVYSTPEQVARQIAEIIERWTTREDTPDPGGYFPKYFSVVLNSSVARSMGISLPGRSELETKLQRLDNGE